MPKFSAYMKGGDGPVGPPGASFISGIIATTTELPPNPPENRRIYLVGNSDPKHIYAYVDGEWVDQGLTASEVARADASISSISWTQEPSVQVSFSTENQKDYFHFKFNIPDERAAINSISTNLNSNYVKKAGDTMTDNLTISKSTNSRVYIKNTSITTGLGNIDSFNSGEIGTFGALDNAGIMVGYVGVSYLSNKSTRTSLVSRQYVNGSLNSNYLQLGVSTDGNKFVTLSNPEVWPFVQKSGDTMTGTLSIKPSIADITADSIASSSERYFRIVDKNDKVMSLYGAKQMTDGSVYGVFTSHRKDANDADVTNYLYLITYKSGNMGVEIPSGARASWRSQLGLGSVATESTVPISKGGTGKTTEAEARKNLGYLGMGFCEAYDDNELSVIPGNQDLNSETYCVTGKYRCTGTDAATLTNCPTTASFQMIVLNVSGNVKGPFGTGSTQNRQRIILDVYGDMYIQRVYKTMGDNVTYYAWKKMDYYEDDTGWEEITADTFTGKMYCRKIGKTVTVQATDIKLATALAAGTYRSLGAIIPDGYMPQKTAYGIVFVNDTSFKSRILATQISNTGTLYIYTNSDDAISTSMNLRISYTYFTA